MKSTCLIANFLFTLLFVGSGTHLLYSQISYLDTSFGAGGIVITPFENNNISITSSILQNDGKIVVAGYANEENHYTHIFLARYNPDGSVDATFNGGLPVITEYDVNTSCYGQTMGITSDGKIVVAGYNVTDSDNSDFMIIRVNTDGSLDPTFDADGKKLTSLGIGREVVAGIVIQPDDKIVIAGTTETGVLNDDHFAIIRYNTDGSFDQTFNNTGYRVIDVTSDPDYITGIELQPDGKMVIVGRTHYCTDHRILFTRLLSNGTTDSTFNNMGYNMISFGTPNNYIYDIALQTDGKIIAAGVKYNDPVQNVNDILVVRLNQDGAKDNSFDNDGILIFDTPIQNGADVGTSIGVLSDGKIMVGGVNYNGNNHDFVLSRINLDGSLDHSFGTNGILITDLQGEYDYTSSSCIQTDNKIILAGYSGNNLSNGVALARYFPEPYSVEGTLSINESHTKNALSVYPNPANSYTTLSVNLAGQENLSFLLYDAYGHLVQTFFQQSFPSGNSSVNLVFKDNFNSGVYYLVVKGNDWLEQKKLVIVN